MVSTVYKGDLAEVTFGHECGLALKHGAFGGGAVTAVATSPTAAGSGYSATTVTTSGGSGSGAEITIAAIADGVISTSAVDDAGASFTIRRERFNRKRNRFSNHNRHSNRHRWRFDIYCYK